VTEGVGDGVGLGRVTTVLTEDTLRVGAA